MDADRRPMTPSDAPGDEPAGVVRSVGLGCDVDAAWHLVSTAEGLDRWLGSDARLDLVVGGSVALRDDDGTLRTGHVVEVVGGRSLTFAWAEPGEVAPASTVTITVEGDEAGSSRVTVQERRSGGRLASCLDAGAAWDDRMLRLEVDVLVGPLAAGAVPAL